MNQVNLIGNLTRDSELSYFTSGSCVLKFSIAINSKKKEGDKFVDVVDFFDCEYFGKNGPEAIQKYMLKSKQVGISGRLKQDRWEKDGEKHSRVKVIAEKITLLGGGREENSGKPEKKTFEDDIPF